MTCHTDILVLEFKKAFWPYNVEEFGPWATFRMLLGNKNAAAKGDIQDPAQSQSPHTTGPSQTTWEAKLGDACREAGGEVNQRSV